MASWGFNVVRLPIAWNFIEPEPGKYDETYFLRYVDRDVAWAKSLGMYIILDMHQYEWSPYFTYHDSWHTAGLPSWMVSAYPNTNTGQAQAKADFWNNLGPNGSVPSGTNPSMQDRFIQAWKYVAARYGQEDAVAAYDLFNEPSADSSDGRVCLYPSATVCSRRRLLDTLPNFLTRVVDAIRSVDSRHMIVWEPAWDIYWAQATSYVRRPNVVYSPHYPGYTWASTSTTRYDRNATQLEALFKTMVVDYAVAWNQPAFVGEWGILVEAANSAQYVHDFADLLDKYLISSTWWTYGRMSYGTALFDKTGNERTVLTAELIRPYLRVSSKPSSSSSFSPDMKEFRIDVEGPATVVVSLPSRYRPLSAKSDKGSTFNLVYPQRAGEMTAGTLVLSVPSEASSVVLAYSSGA
jgi:endoglycosylceramidase